MQATLPNRSGASPKKVIEEEVIRTTVPAISVYLPDDSMTGSATFWKAMSPISSLHKIYFRRLVKKQVFEHSVALAASEIFVLASSPYNTRHTWDDEKSKHDIFDSPDIRPMSKFCSKMLGLGAHGSIFSNTSQLGLYYRIFFKLWRSRRGLVGLVLNLIKKTRRRRHWYLELNRIVLSTHVPLVLKAVRCSQHSTEY